FNPGMLRQNIEEVLDGVYAWLNGEADQPEFSVDLTQAKQKLADGLGSYATARAEGLPLCGAGEMPTEFDALNATCLPPGLTPAEAGSSLQNEILGSEEFLKQTVFTADDIKFESEGRQVSLGDAGQAQALRDSYVRSKNAPVVLG